MLLRGKDFPKKLCQEILFICANGILKDKSPVEEGSRRIICFWERVKTSKLLLEGVENGEIWRWSSECLAQAFNAGAQHFVIGAGILR